MVHGPVSLNGAHPRVRGDVGPYFRVSLVVGGSPPRARGRRQQGAAWLVLWGLTPACAGTSYGALAVATTARAHPRVRGDVIGGPTRFPPASGSPPRARGRQADAVDQLGTLGLTPACAGTSSSRKLKTAGSWAHPRVRGDVTGTIHRQARAAGSPPRARGRPWYFLPALPPAGLTPACAGTSGCGCDGCAVAGAHPRVRGDVR